ncbi:hypothetical protein RQP46_008845 [Phenoliferia psychrophenolica]
MPCCYAVIGNDKFGLLHASYGLGALVCPLAATAFASSNIQFSYFYGISVGLSLVNLAILIWSFRLTFRIEEASAPEEVSMGGWIVTFIIDERDGGPSAGYVATGFWGGITLGRAVLPWLNVRFSIWFSKNLVGNAVTVAIIGFVIAPLYPIVMSLATKLLPRHLHSSAIGFIAAIGEF